MSTGMQDMLIATVKLVDRVGGKGFDVGYLNDDEGVTTEDAEWYAACHWQGTRLSVDGRRSPDEACLALCIRLLRGATCKCVRPVVIDDGEPGCRWRLMGDTWQSSCDAAPIPVSGARGDTVAITAAFGRRLDAALIAEPVAGNRKQRRAARRKR